MLDSNYSLTIIVHCVLVDIKLGDPKQNEGWSQQFATKSWNKSKFLNIKKGLTFRA